MSSSVECVLDASAIIAYLYDEPGSDTVLAALENQSHISAVNWAEILSKIQDHKSSHANTADNFGVSDLLHQSLQIHSFDEFDALNVAQLRPLTRKYGLSFGDRACLALGRRLNLPVIAADR